MPDASGATGEFYWDAGDGFGYRQGDYRRSTFRARRQGERWVVTESAHEGNRAPDWKRQEVILNGRPLGRQATYTPGA